MAVSIRTVKRALLNAMDSATFYRQAMGMDGQEPSHHLFVGLAEQEVDHARELARRVSQPSLHLDFDVHGYVEKLEKRPSGGMSPLDKKAIRERDTKAVLTLAQHREAEARHIYQMLARETRDPSMKGFCEELARGEQAHLDQIGKLEVH